MPPQQVPSTPYPQQQFPYPAPAQPQQAPATPAPVSGTLSDFYSQPASGGGKAISWKDKPTGYTVAGIIARPITDADIRQTTNPQGVPQFYKDGRPKLEMVVPLKVQASQEFPEGEVRWFVRGQARDELTRAMAEAGASGAPEAGAAVSITLTGRRPTGPGMNPANQFAIRYQRPQDASSASQQPVEQDAQPAVRQQQPTPAQPSEQSIMPQPSQQQESPAVPEGLSPEQQALLARLTGGQAA